MYSFKLQQVDLPATPLKRLDVLRRFDPERKFGANAGLEVARDLLEPIKKQFDWITWVLGFHLC